MRRTEQPLAPAIGELRCIRTGEPATIDELTGLAVAEREFNVLLLRAFTRCAPARRAERSGREHGSHTGGLEEGSRVLGGPLGRQTTPVS